MCGIWACIGCPLTKAETIHQTNRVRGRGPESTEALVLATATLGFARLALNDLTPQGMQPFSQGGIHWICNGEIYNWKEVADRHAFLCLSASDCSVLGPLWAKFRDSPETFFRALDGVFALVLVDEATGLTTVGRDPYGVRPLFYAQGLSRVYVASEMKALVGLTKGPIQAVPPGNYLQFETATGARVRRVAYHAVPWIKNPAYTHEEVACAAIKDALVAAVRKRLMTERPVAALLSGGVDSSLIAALVQRERKALGKPPLETFTIGFAGSPDLAFAREAAAWMGSKHTELVVTPDAFFEAVPAVIRDIESYDITTVRASVGNWFVARDIRRLSEAKVVFNGDGADEVFGSYLYCFRAPDDESYEAEVTRLLSDIHLFDVLRSDRSISSHGLEARTPFLDKQFVSVVRSVATSLLRPQKGVRPEKALLRKAFEAEGLLPPSVLWRQKEAFSDGVSGTSKSWYQEIQDRVPIGAATSTWTHNPPPTAEARYYRTLFDADYGSPCEQVIPYFWMPRWSGETSDPSARTLSIY